jgi:hypothetical protein
MIRLLRRLFVGRCSSRFFLMSPVRTDSTLVMPCVGHRQHRGNHRDSIGMFEWTS